MGLYGGVVSGDGLDVDRLPFLAEDSIVGAKPETGEDHAVLPWLNCGQT